MMKKILSFTLNGAPVEVLVKPTDTLLDVLRETLQITGTKRGCDNGECGVCTVLCNGEPIRACLTLALVVNGAEVVTVEGLSQNGQLAPLQKAFHEHAASQCGFCTSGMLISAKALLDKNPNPSYDEIVTYMAGNLCRCGTYREVIEAIQAVAGGE